MAKLLKGKPVASKIGDDIKRAIENLRRKGITPTLSTILVGENADSLSYRGMIEKKAKSFGIEIVNKEYPSDISQDKLENEIKLINRDEHIHGVLLFQPLPKHLDVNRIRYIIDAKKDIDGLSPINIAKVFSGEKDGIPPATPQAVIEILDFYEIPLVGKNIVVIGRSLVVGRPLAMLLLHKNATVTITHSKTKDLKKIAKRADIVIAALGRKEAITKDYLSAGQIVIDVGINVEDGKLYGDVAFEDAEKIVDAITPVPGGVGSVTTSVLFKHLVRAASY